MARGNASKKAKAAITAAGGGEGASGAEQRAQAQAQAPLPRGSHTAQLLFHTAVHTILIGLSAFVLPAHRLATREVIADEPAYSSSSSSPLSLVTSISHYFALPDNADNSSSLLRLQWGTLQALLLTQAWACIRFQRWYDLGAAIERGDRAEAERLTGKAPTRRRGSGGIAGGLLSNLGVDGFMAGLERLTMTTLTNLPVACIAIHVVVVLLGAPLTQNITASLQLSLGVGLMVALPLLNVLPADLQEWARILGPAGSTRSPRERLLLIQTLLPLVASFLCSAALTFDHGKAWLSWPVPPLVGLFAGAMLGNVVGTVDYLLA